MIAPLHLSLISQRFVCLSLIKPNPSLMASTGSSMLMDPQASQVLNNMIFYNPTSFSISFFVFFQEKVKIRVSEGVVLFAVNNKRHFSCLILQKLLPLVNCNLFPYKLKIFVESIHYTLFRPT